VLSVFLSTTSYLSIQLQIYPPKNFNFFPNSPYKTCHFLYNSWIMVLKRKTHIGGIKSMYATDLEKNCGKQCNKNHKPTTTITKNSPKSLKYHIYVVYLSPFNKDNVP